MNVAELIARLQELPDDAPVMVYGPDGKLRPAMYASKPGKRQPAVVID